METINGITLQGSIPGIVYGAPYLTTGIAGNALYLDGYRKYVDLGVHPKKCFYFPEACAGGVRYSLWLLVHSGYGTVFDNGGHGKGYCGYFMRRRKDNNGGNVMVPVRTSSLIETCLGTIIPHAEWNHIVFTWSRGNGIRMYMNGCDADPGGRHGYYQNQTHSKSFNAERKFFLGRNTLEGQYGNLNIDELFIWHQVLQPAQVWRLFLQGGVASAWQYKMMWNNSPRINVLQCGWNIESPTQSNLSETFEHLDVSTFHEAQHQMQRSFSPGTGHLHLI